MSFMNRANSLYSFDLQYDLIIHNYICGIFADNLAIIVYPDQFFACDIESYLAQFQNHGIMIDFFEEAVAQRIMNILSCFNNLSCEFSIFIHVCPERVD